GFSSDYPVERAFRDQRVNRIFEGTNEINRLLITDMLMKRSMKGELGLIPAAQRLLDEILSLPPADESEADGPLAEEAGLVGGALVHLRRRRPHGTRSAPGARPHRRGRHAARATRRAQALLAPYASRCHRAQAARGQPRHRAPSLSICLACRRGKGGSEHGDR